MKRQIKFRGLRTDGKGWVYGHYTQGSDTTHYITNPNGAVWEVTHESVGQFTGLHDKNGKEIHEGDILSSELWEGDTHIVFYEQDNRYIGYWFPKDDIIEIIGNIHES